MKYRVAGSAGRKSWRAWILFALVILGGGSWLAWKFGYLSSPRSDSTTPLRTNSLNAQDAPVKTNGFRVISRAQFDALMASNSTGQGGREEMNADKFAAVLETQIALDRLGISCGSIDGVVGSQTRRALRAFQLREGLPLTGELDTNTRARLTLNGPVLASYRVEAGDVARLLPLAATWLGKSEQPRLDYESLLEAVAERAHAHPGLLQRLNPGVNWNGVAAGTVLVLPATERARTSSKAAFIQIRLGERTLAAFDADNKLLAHFPCSIAQRMDKRPVGELRVAVVAPNPNYTFDPEVFPESAEAQALGRKLILPPGPNNPVGTVWIGLDRPGYGIHGTPKPEDVGRTESHGCFRLANWNAEFLLQLVTVGTVVKVEP